MSSDLERFLPALLGTLGLVCLSASAASATPRICVDPRSEAPGGVPLTGELGQQARDERGRPLAQLLRPERGFGRERTTLTAEAVFGREGEFVEARGSVDLRTATRQILADAMRYDLAQDVVNARGHVLIRSWQDVVFGPELSYGIETQTGYMSSPSFALGLYKGRGYAERLEFAGPDRYRLLKARYTTCAGEHPAWRLEVGELDLDEASGVGTARDARVLIGEWPVAWLPRLSFPLTNERKSGFLAPTYGTSEARGFDLQLPYYLNLAPNYDATLTPRLMTKRGLLLHGELRYIVDSPLGRSSGELEAEVLPDDRVTGRTRRALDLRHAQQIAPNLDLTLRYRAVGDPRHFADLSDRVAVTSITTLPREATLSYRAGDWHFTARVLRFQTLQDPAAFVLPPYDRAPQLTLDSPLWRFGPDQRFEAHLRLDATRFLYPIGTNPSGDRWLGVGTLAWRYETPGAFVVPRVRLHASRYRLLDVFDDVENQTRVVPLGSLDAGLRFERETRLFGERFTQTLEPRAMFTHVPYRNQSSVPVFDTAIADFNLLQLWSENRYIGEDRLGDTTQIALGVTSRLFDAESQKERLALTLGQRIYLTNQRVTLGEVPRDRNTSDVLATLAGRVTDALYVEAGAQINLDRGRLERHAVALRYRPEPTKTFNLNYRSIRELVTLSGPIRVQQVDVSGQWPIAGGWYAVGRLNYSLADRQLTEGVAGLEYDGCCYVVRAVVQRLATGTRRVNNAFFLQLELNGLARVGANPIDLLRRNIPGYTQLYENPTRRRLDPPASRPN
ncbi:MAG: LPS-assembly protein LptD [Casimicrobiaceae bacterium]|nr:LPS-assembly protein LptD [Casimicrobiaceae bacterium]